MDRAYDIFEKSIVFANSISKSRNRSRKFRCPCCHNEVLHVYSRKITSYFKHRDGNNNTKCENYFKQEIAPNNSQLPQKKKNEQVEFYFDINKKMFFLGIRLNDEKINSYEQKAALFELLTSKNERASSPLKINNKNFFHNIFTMIPIEKFSFRYFFNIHSDSTNKSEEYEVFKTNSNPTFFKILGNDDTNFKAKLVHKDTLYTNIPYFAVSPIQWDSHLTGDIEIKNTLTFETMGKRFVGKYLTIVNKTTKTEALLLSWGYKLEKSETLTLLWPPAFIDNDISYVKLDYAYFYSTFKSHPKNKDVNSIYIQEIMNSVLKLSFKSKKRIIISNRNIEFEIVRDRRDHTNLIGLPVSEKHENVYTVSDDNQYFLFNRSGIKPMSKGQSITLTQSTIIKSYLFGYLNICIYPKIQKKIAGDQLLIDILAHYKQTEVYKENDFDSLEFSETALKYIKSCKTTRLINTAVKNFIKEGRI